MNDATQQDRRIQDRKRKYRDTDRREEQSEFSIALAKQDGFSRFDTGWIRRALKQYDISIVCATAWTLDVPIEVMLKAIHAPSPAMRFEGGQFKGNTTLRTGNLHYR